MHVPRPANSKAGIEGIMEAVQNRDDLRAVTIFLTEDVYETACEFAADCEMEVDEYIAFLVRDGHG